MSPSPHRTKLDDLLTAAVDLQPRPDFAVWRQNHPAAVAALQSFPTTLSKRRSKMIRIARYSTSVALLLFVAVGVWWMFFSNGTASAWAQMVEQLAKVRSATCRMSVYEDGHCGETDQVYIEGDRVRSEGRELTAIMDFYEGKALYAEHDSKKATIVDLRKEPGGRAVLGSNPLNDLVKLKDAATKRQPDETIEGIACHVYRVDNPVLLGSKVPWVKLWVDSQSNLPVQVHMVIGGDAGHPTAMTFDQFRWNKAFDKDLLKLAAPQGYTLFDEQEGNKPKTATTASMQAAVAAWDAMEGARANRGRELQGEEAAKILDMLSRRTEANYKAIHSWSGSYGLGVTSAPVPAAVVVFADFFLDNRRERTRIDYHAAVARPQAKSSPDPEFREYIWVRTAEHSLRFPTNELRSSVEGFPSGGDRSGEPFRILYREGSEPTHRFDASDAFVDPRSFLGGNYGLPYWEGCSARAAALRGEHSKYCSNPDFVKRNMMLRERRSAAATEYVLFLRYGSELVENVFSSQAGFNVVSKRRFSQRRVTMSEKTTFRQEKGIFIPVEADFNARTLCHFILKQSKLNEPIDPAVFEISSLSLRRGDRLADWIEHRVQVFDGKQFVPVEQFKQSR
jgi:hypothetical protein